MVEVHASTGSVISSGRFSPVESRIGVRKPHVMATEARNSDWCRMASATIEPYDKIVIYCNAIGTCRDVAAFEKQMRRKAHYVIKPEHLWTNIAHLARTQSPELITANNYRILIDRVNLESDEVDIRPRHEGDLDRVLAHLDGPTIDVGQGGSLEPEVAELVLTNARFEGRVFDTAGERLPAEGLGISGHVPLNVRLARTGDDRRPVEVQFEVPARFFDGIEWSV